MKILAILTVVTILIYSIVGVSTRVDEIKARAPTALEEKGLNVIRYEGYQFGSWSRHGGKVWYLVKDATREGVYYRVNISLWDDELQYYYSAPEKLIQINHADMK